MFMSNWDDYFVAYHFNWNRFADTLDSGSSIVCRLHSADDDPRTPLFVWMHAKEKWIQLKRARLQFDNYDSTTAWIVSQGNCRKKCIREMPSSLEPLSDECILSATIVANAPLWIINQRVAMCISLMKIGIRDSYRLQTISGQSKVKFYWFDYGLACAMMLQWTWMQQTLHVYVSNKLH